MNSDTNDDILSLLFLRIGAARIVVLFVFHAIVFIGCYILAWLLRFDFNIAPDFAALMKSSLPVVVAVQLVVGIFFGYYHGWWRYVGMAEVVRLVIGLTTSLAVLLLGWYVGGYFGWNPSRVHVPRGVLLVDWAFALLTLFGTRVIVRVGRDRMRSGESPQSERRVLILGAGDAGEALAREIEHRPQLGLKVVGFVDDHRAKWKSRIRGIEVTGPISDIAHISDFTAADEALIAIPSASGKRIREIIHHLSAADLKFKTMPGMDQIVSGKIQVTQLRPVDVDDLLRRKRIDLPGDPVRDLFRGQRVLVTGAGGTIGAELASQVLTFEPESLTLVERSEYALYECAKRLGRQTSSSHSPLRLRLVDICDSDVVRSLFEDTRPQIVLHAAAHKHVPLGEENPAEYIRNNSLATRTLSEISEATDVERFVFISTDKAINPASVMGATKRAAEILLLDLARTARMKITIVRFGNVIGSSGSVTPLFMEQIAAGGPITVTHPEVTRYFIRKSEAISLVLQAATLGNGGHIFMLDMGEPIKIADLARDLIRLSNQSADEVSIVFTGLRPGEKLFEEIRLQGESIHPTVHPQIVVTESPQPAEETVRRWMASTLRIPEDASQARALLQQIVAEYATTGNDSASKEPRESASGFRSPRTHPLEVLG